MFKPVTDLSDEEFLTNYHSNRLDSVAGDRKNKCSLVPLAELIPLLEAEKENLENKIRLVETISMAYPDIMLDPFELLHSTVMLERPATEWLSLILEEASRFKAAVLYRGYKLEKSKLTRKAKKQLEERFKLSEKDAKTFLDEIERKYGE